MIQETDDGDVASTARDIIRSMGELTAVAMRPLARLDSNFERSTGDRAASPDAEAPTYPVTICVSGSPTLNRAITGAVKFGFPALE